MSLFDIEKMRVDMQRDAERFARESTQRDRENRREMIKISLQVGGLLVAVAAAAGALGWFGASRQPPPAPVNVYIDGRLIQPQQPAPAPAPR